mmetsp:Transcript_36615/g.85046  ORF Transcript_36615/g.85046 Transcript_36615/m.85046 type:complete len:99 (+) Transcript_36615:3-299(+)
MCGIFMATVLGVHTLYVAAFLSSNGKGSGSMLPILGGVHRRGRGAWPHARFAAGAGRRRSPRALHLLSGAALRRPLHHPARLPPLEGRHGGAAVDPPL